MRHAHIQFTLVFGTHILGEEGVLQALHGGRALLRVPLEHLEDEVDCVGGRIRNDRLQRRYRTAGEVDAARHR